MRRLIVCPACRRQYDASNLSPGKRMRCHCGEVVVVPEPRSHDAKVVRCSSCGAPRQEGSAFCAHCGSDFTLHELDMQTVCPNCLTRVSDRARFCHSCGGELNAEMIAGETTPLPCPACEGGPRMHSRRLGKQKITVMECDRCAGLWLGNQTFTRLAERVAAEAFAAEQTGKTPRPQPPGLRSEAGGAWQYRKCPACNKLMVRKQYGSASGVIVDFCREHGTWFDTQELPAILGWIRNGGQARSEAVERKTREQHRRAEQRRAGSPPVVRSLSSDESPVYRGTIWGVLFQVLDELFH